jgi:uncharacterized protein YegJ (DUF2314 family)
MVLAFFLSGLARHAHSGVVDVRHDDPELDVAIEYSRRLLPQFIKQLQNPPKDAISYAIKARLVQGNQAELLWVDHLTYAQGVFNGKLADSPVVISGLHKGDGVNIPEAQVVDWLVLHRTPEGDLQEGGETDRVLRRRQAGHTLRYPRRMPTSAQRSA